MVYFTDLLNKGPKGPKLTHTHPHAYGSLRSRAGVMMSVWCVAGDLRRREYFASLYEAKVGPSPGSVPLIPWYVF